jgi:hypothetical protein
MDKKQQEAQQKLAQQQRALRQIAAEKEQRVAELYTEKLDSTLFPRERLSANWMIAAGRALALTPPLANKTSLKDLQKVWAYDFEKGISLYQFGCLSNCLETVSADQLGLFAKGYMELLEEAVSHIEFYGQESKRILGEAQMQAEAEFKAKAMVNDSNGKRVLSSIKGEA